MIKSISTTTLRNNLKDTMDHVRTSKEPLIITEIRAEPTAILIDLDEFEDLLSTKNRDFKQSIVRAREQYKKGQTYSMNDVFGDIV